MEKRYQVFVSSTYTDLKEERSKVIQTIMELDCIPAGMEIFPAIDDEQLNFIKRIIDDCDYYLLIIGGRYGTLSADGLSYTEKEFDYAVQKDIKVIAFIHENPDDIPLGKSEKDELLKEKLRNFKSRVSTGRLVKSWNKADELPGLVALSLSKTIKTYPAVGWVRANLTSNFELLQELHDQRKENQELKDKIFQYSKEKNDDFKTEDLAELKESFKVTGYYPYNSSTWEIDVTWEKIFALISPFLLEHPNDLRVESTLSKALSELTNRSPTSTQIHTQVYQTIKIQLKVLGLVTIDFKKSSKGTMALFWSLTDKGERLMYELRSIKKDDF